MSKRIHCRSSNAYSAVATAALLPASLASIPFLRLPITHLSAGPLATVDRDLRLSHIFSGSVPPPGDPIFAPNLFTRVRKPIAAMYQARRGFLHSAVSKPPRPQRATASPVIHPRGRGDSDTVLTNIGSYFSPLARRARSSRTDASSSAVAGTEVVGFFRQAAVLRSRPSPGQRGEP